MPNKNRSKDSKDFAAKQTLNPPAGGKAPSAHATIPNPTGPDADASPSGKVGQFTGRGAPGLQKK